MPELASTCVVMSALLLSYREGGRGHSPDASIMDIDVALLSKSPARHSLPKGGVLGQGQFNPRPRDNCEG
eukprot:3536116-Pyramimonas_sp.AAC.1